MYGGWLISLIKPLLLTDQSVFLNVRKKKKKNKKNQRRKVVDVVMARGGGCMLFFETRVGCDYVMGIWSTALVSHMYGN